MFDYYEIDFLGVETDKSGDAITLRYSINGKTGVHVVDGGYVDTGDQIIEHLKNFYGTTHVNNVVLTHPDQDHANGLRKVLENCTVDALWMNRPWLYAEEIIHRFSTYNSVDALRRELRNVYAASATLEDLANKKGIPIHAPFQGSLIGPFQVLSPTKARYLDLVVESDKTPSMVKSLFDESIFTGVYKAAKAIGALVAASWGEEYFPVEGTSNENEMSVVQFANLVDTKILLTGDTGREGLSEAADYAPRIGLVLPGIDKFQVPHHGGRHNVSTELLDRWLGPRLSSRPEAGAWEAICSSAKADIHHPKNSVKRAMLHRGAHFVETEGRCVRSGKGIEREGWVAVPAAEYPTTQED